ncbi:MAG: hypothetical protein JWR62_2970 [Modestobacter sp.]|nr:hypothetical protein [Modestobacter sp.]
MPLSVTVAAGEALIAAVLGEVCARPVRYRPRTIEEARATRRPSGRPDRGGRGLGDPASAAVPTLAGHPARPLATVLRSIPGCGVDRRRGPGQLPAAVITFQRSRL